MESLTTLNLNHPYQLIRSRSKKSMFTLGVLIVVSACGSNNQVSANLAADDLSIRTPIFVKLSDTPENLAQPNYFRVWLAASAELVPQTVRLCKGDVAACRLPGAVFVTTRSTSVNGKIFYVTDQAVELSENIFLTAVAQVLTGNQIIQKTVRVSASNSLSQPVFPIGPQPLQPQPLQPQPNFQPIQPIASTDCYKGEPLVCEAEKLIVEYTNAYRQQSGRSALRHHAKIAFVSRDWSAKQANEYGMGHKGFSEGWRDDVYSKEFNGMGSVSLSAENVAMSGYGLSDAQKIARHFTDMWWESPGHKANMLGNHVLLGAGVYKSANGWYATQLFGRE